MNDLFRLSPFLFHTAYIAHRVAFCLIRLFFTLVENSYTLIVSIHYSPSFSDMFCFLPLCKKICLHSTKQMFIVFVVLLLICVRESSAYVNSYVVMTSTLLTAVSMSFIIALATASNCSIGNVVALLCITSRWRRAV